MTEKERIDDLERRVKELEKQIARQIPWRDKLGPKPGDEPMWPDDPFKLPPSPKWPDNIDEWKCSVCGIGAKEGGFYCCQNPNCPNRITC